MVHALQCAAYVTVSFGPRYRLLRHRVVVVLLQIEHHLFPRMPRHNLRMASAAVAPLCARLGLRYHSPSFLGVSLWTKRTLSHCSVHCSIRRKPHTTDALMLLLPSDAHCFLCTAGNCRDHAAPDDGGYGSEES